MCVLVRVFVCVCVFGAIIVHMHSAARVGEGRFGVSEVCGTTEGVFLNLFARVLKDKLGDKYGDKIFRGKFPHPPNSRPNS